MKKQRSQSTHKKSLMSRNVTEFRHFLIHPYINQDNLNWTIGLREPLPTKPTPTEMSAPDVYNKKTKTLEIRAACPAKSSSLDYAHLYLSKTHHNGPKHTEDQLNFYGQLRTHQHNPQKAEFDTRPFKQRELTSQLLSKQAIKKTSGILKTDKESAMDGAHKQGPYSEDILKTKNYGLLETFISNPNPRGKVSLPSLAWQIGLRSYR